MNYLKLVINIICYKYNDVFIYALAIVIGLVLATRVRNDENIKKVIGVVILLAALGVERIVPHILENMTTIPGYVVVSMVSIICRIVAIIVAFHFFSDYRPSRWVCGLLTVIVIVALFRIIYQANIVYGLGSLSKDSSAGILVLLAFMNNPGAVKTIKLLCNLMPAAAIFLDALSTTKKL